jgi:hypothetical protein
MGIDLNPEASDEGQSASSQPSLDMATPTETQPTTRRAALGTTAAATAATMRPKPWRPVQKIH